MGPVGLEPTTPALSRRCSNQLSYGPLVVLRFRQKVVGGGMGIRTPDIQLAKLTLYQLSYTPLRGRFQFQGFRFQAGLLV
jgi:hypothetical protein